MTLAMGWLPLNKVVCRELLVPLTVACKPESLNIIIVHAYWILSIKNFLFHFLRVSHSSSSRLIKHNRPFD